MENKIVHPKLGEFIEKVLKVAHVNLSKMCQEIHMGPATYHKVIKGKKKLGFIMSVFLNIIIGLAPKKSFWRK